MRRLPDLGIWSGIESTVTNTIRDLDRSPPHRQCVPLLSIFLVDMTRSANGQAVGGNHPHSTVAPAKAYADDSENMHQPQEHA